jgi:hypothetical protein
MILEKEKMLKTEHNLDSSAYQKQFLKKENKFLGGILKANS